MLVRKGYRYRIYPTKTQVQRLRQWEGALRWLWNMALEQHFAARRMGPPQYPTAYAQINELTGLRKDIEWLRDVPRNVCAQLLVELALAWERSKNGLARRPRWKARGRDRVNPCEPHEDVWRIDGDRIRFPKLGYLRAVIHRPIEGVGKTCRIVEEAGQWFACISAECEVADPIAPTGDPVGIDRGVINLLADNNGRIVPNHRYLEASQRRLSRAQRKLAKAKKGSKNREKARHRVAVLHRTVRRQRDHVLHVESAHYAKSHSVVVVEDLQIANMTASARGTVDEPGRCVRQKAGLNRGILGAAWGRFGSMLDYKAAWKGSRVEKVPAAYSSQTCARCGHVDAASRVSQAVFHCVSCGHRDHADSNAAKVILSRRSVGGAVCGGQGAVGPPTKQKLRVVRRGQRSMGSGAQAVSFDAKAPAFRPG